MTFKHKLSVRLALVRDAVMAFPAALILACAPGDGALAPGQTPFADVTQSSDTVFAEDFESGTLNAWQDGVDPARHRVVMDSTFARSGSRYLDVTYPAGGDGGWLTRFFMPGYDSLYVSYYVRFPTTWQGSTKLVAFYGSRTDNQWSAFGKSGACPNGTDFFAAMLVTDAVNNAGSTKFYSYYPTMAREPDGVTCWGRFGDGTETYAPLALSTGAWHHVEYWMKLNTPGEANAVQTFWIDGVQRGSWSGLSFRNSTILALNSVQLTFSTGAAPQTQHVYVDDLVVRTQRSAASNPPPPPPPPPPSTETTPGTVNDLSVVAANDTSVTLSFTEVTDGTGQPASYDVRSAVGGGSLTWPTASSVTRGSCATPVSGSAIDAQRTCTVAGLSPSTGYAFQLVAFRGTLNVNAVFGGLSNVASGSTVASLPTVGPVDSVVMSPASGSVKVGQELQLSATPTDSAGGVLSGRIVTWASSAPAVATVSSSGLVTGVMTGTTTITATSERVIGRAAITVTATKPGKVIDLAVAGTTDSSVTLSFTEVNDGTGRPAKYDVRSSAGTISWAEAPSVTRGSCATPVGGSGIGAKRTCTVLGLTAATAYQFRLVAFRGTLDLNAVFGALSNIASGSTVSAPAAPAPVASVVVSPGTVSQLAGTTQQLDVVLKDAGGTVLTNRAVTWTSNNSSVATVNGSGLEMSVAVGTATITATSEGVSGNAAITVTAAKPSTVSDLAVASVTDSSVTLSFTEVSDGAGAPASYDLRAAGGTLWWGSAASVTRGSCATPLSGSAVGARRTCTVAGLSPSTGYQFQLVAFRGTLNVDAVFSALSNVASGTTAGSSAPPPPPPSSGLWPNEPAGFRVLNNQPWDLLTSLGWNYLRRRSSKDADIWVDLTAPFSPVNGLRMVFTTDMGFNQEPSVHWLGLSGIKEIYTAWWIKLSSNWTGSPAGAGKITFLFASGAGQVYTGLYHQGGDPSGWVNGPPYRIGVNTEWGPYGQRVWLPNATTTFLNPGEWHRIEAYYRWETTPGSSGDGIIRWWVDGVLNGNYTNVSYPASNGFSEFQFAPTLQNPPPAEQYMYVDHTYVSRP